LFGSTLLPGINKSEEKKKKILNLRLLKRRRKAAQGE
jgi:hypothetical protein